MSKISELSDGGSLLPTDDLIVVRSGGNVRVKADTVNVDQIRLGDDEQIQLGNSQDLTLVHTPTQSIINQAGTGDLLIQKAGATKLTVNSTGIDVTGSVTADGANIDGAVTTGDLTIDNDDTPTLNFKKAASADILGTINVTTDAGSGGKMVFQTKRNGDTALDRITIDDGGNVGIGSATANHFSTAGATNILGVKGTSGGLISIAATGTNFSGIDVGTDTTRRGGIYSLDGSHLAFYTNATNSGGSLTEAMRIDASGNVGINTTNPAQRFVVAEGTDQHGIELAPGTLSYIQAYDRATADYGDLKIDAQTIQFGTDNGTEAMRIDASGNVGIGTSSPDTKLHVMGNSSVRNTLVSTLTLDAGTSAANPYTGFGTGIDFKGRDYSDVVRNYAGIYSIMFGNTSSTNPAGDPGFTSALTFHTNTGGASGTNPTEKMRIDGSGNVKIGTGTDRFSYLTASTANLQIDGGLVFEPGSGNNVEIFNYRSTDMLFGNGATEAMRIDSSGNVGIGVSNPSDYYAKDLVVTGPAEGGITIASTGNHTNYLLFADSTSGVARYAGMIGYAHDTDTMSFRTNSVERMAINSDGKVDVGGAANQTTAVLNARFNGAAIEFGHGNNSNGYYGTAGSYGNNGQPYIGFSCYSQENLNLFTTTGFKGNIITADLSGNLTFAQITTASGTNLTPANRMTLDASGNLLVSDTTANPSGDNVDSGIALHNAGLVRASTNNAAAPLDLNVKGRAGTIVDFRKDGTTVGSISAGALSGGINPLAIGHSTSGLWFIPAAQAIAPFNMSTNSAADNSIDWGYSSIRWDDIYATNGTIQTSDRNEKQDIEELSDAEQRVAVAAKGLLRKFRWISSVEENGDNARTHFGIIAQDLQAAFEAEGLDAGDYAMFINSTWTDEETGEERSRMGVRYHELLAFIIAAI